MKRILFLAALVSAFLVVTACYYYEDQTPTHPNLVYIQDFEYLAETLKENFPYFGIASRRFGVDAEQIIQNTRQALLDTEIRDAEHFRQILQSNFILPMRHIGHLSIQDTATLRLILGNAYRGPLNYNGQELDLQGREFTYYAQKFVDTVHSETARQFYGVIEGSVQYGNVIPNNLTTEIIDADNGIAYVRVNAFHHYNIPQDLELMMDFYDQISDFNHLIIDLRGNGGGFTRYFVQLFMAPIIPYDLEMPGIYTLVMGGAQNMPWLETYLLDAHLFGRYHEKNSLADELHRFPYLIDAEKFDYIVTISNNFRSTGQNLFNGEVWILIDQNSASAAEYASLYSMATGFATVVGEPTRGITGGGMVAFVTLPNTGIIVRYDFGYFIDSEGRSIDEFGVMPHHFNQPGMDALQTTLHLILDKQ
ncbi:MAG: S41 family peptidase [Defluviitaleaceae bacterium]|nr:S41 family peptidase [Defluviitaleaceae bacterium]